MKFTIKNSFFYPGNTVRRVFENPIFLAAQIGVSKNLVKGLINIWILLRSNLVLDGKAFQKYCQFIKAMYILELPWCQMNPSLLKVLDHGHLILLRLPPTLTIGMYMSLGIGITLDNYIKSFF